MAATISSGSDMRPGPCSLQAMAPSLGPMKVTPRFFSVSTLATVAACVHMRTFIAGAASTGLSVASNTVDGEIVGQARCHAGQDVGGGGRHDQQVGVAAAAGCDPSRSRRSARTCRNRRDPPRAPAVTSGVTNLAPRSVSTQRTEAPRSRSRRISSSDLKAAMPPATIGGDPLALQHAALAVSQEPAQRQCRGRSAASAANTATLNCSTDSRLGCLPDPHACQQTGHMATAETRACGPSSRPKFEQRDGERQRGGAEHDAQRLDQLGGLISRPAGRASGNDRNADQPGDEARDHADHRRQRLLEIGQDAQAHARQAHARMAHQHGSQHDRNAQLGPSGRPATW